MEHEKLKSIIESLLFVSGEPLKIRKIAEIVGNGVGNEEVRNALYSLKDDFTAAKRGLRIIEHNNEAQMVSSPDNSEYLNRFLKSEMEQNLSRASLETLSIVAYRGPLTRSGIEEIRGVNCTFTLRYLLLRGLIERTPNPGDFRSYLYQISFDFLKKLNLSRKEDLPKYEELSR
ncbi:SMC-Scp complex subunit ScpB [Patescibacteria group bacterium]|nr:SMC-Scp complex subunit ScpB [Patescibacteria group bacterium]MBU3999638.1 SMC-Scp complex subunit ScpB [Patescibacteria group bacterium]MBU4056396.1 SMC-Scp complex subunit ScpB [Patescibacteria group bacterium]MBU4368205.1 SMC-Scp complex subunit ScpB [Patescibacteria group bacterium]